MKIKIPEYLKDYINREKERLAKNCIDAYLMEEDVKYKIVNEKKDGKDNEIITPIDNENTGTILKKTNLSYGLHQFLQLKHSCQLTPMNLISSYLSNYGFFKLYRNDNYNNILGLTGTLGSEKTKNLLDTIYNLDFVYIPTVRERLLKELRGIIDINDDNWLNSIYKTCKRESDSKRIVLIICKSIKDVNNIYQKFVIEFEKEEKKNLNQKLNNKKKSYYIEMILMLILLN